MNDLTNLLDFPDGMLNKAYKDTGCSAIPKGEINFCGKKAEFSCSWGGGYEYECAELCKEHFLEAVKLLSEFANTIK